MKDERRFKTINGFRRHFTPDDYMKEQREKFERKYGYFQLYLHDQTRKIREMMRGAEGRNAE